MLVRVLVSFHHCSHFSTKLLHFRHDPEKEQKSIILVGDKDVSRYQEVYLHTHSHTYVCTYTGFSDGDAN